MQENSYQAIRIAEIISEGEGYKRFIFEEGHGILYKAGQYLTFLHQGLEGEVRRSYSITSSPAIPEPLSIGVKRIENGFFSRMLVDKALPGDQLITTGAGGLFTFPKNLEGFRQVFFFAAGSGITPIFSLIKTLLHAHAPIQAVLVYSNPSPERTLFLAPLKNLQEQFKGRLTIEFLFSNSPDLLKAHLYRDLLLDLLKKHGKAGLNEILFYTCGPEAYMRMVIYNLNEQGVPGENIKRENFIIPQTRPPVRVPPDKEAHRIKIKMGENIYEFAAQYPDTILSAARKQGLSFPYSCEAGRCGNCVALCTSGKTWLSYNEVLTEKDLQEGLTLTCVAYPVFGDVELEI